MAKPFPTFELLDRFILRLPTLSIAKAQAVIEHPNPVKAALALIEDPNIKEALFVASPALLKQLTTTQVKDAKKMERAGYALVKYLLRMATRSTPFGLFSSVSVGYFSSAPSSSVTGTATFSRRTRLDFGVLGLLYEHLVTMPEIQEKLAFIPNSSLYAIGADYRYIVKSGDLDQRKYSLQQVIGSEMLGQVISFFKDGKTIAQLIKFLSKAGYDADDAQEFAMSLVEAQLVMPSIQPSVVGQSYLSYLLASVKKLNAENDLHAKMQKIETYIQKIDSEAVNSPENYQEARKYIQSLIPKKIPELPFQVDLFKQTETLTLSKKEKHLLLKGLQFLTRLKTTNNTDPIQLFKRAFSERYAGNPVRLVDVLDIDMGLGYPLGANQTPYPYIADLNLNSTRTIQETKARSHLEMELTTLLNLNEDTTVLELTDDTLTSLKSKSISIPPTFSALTERIVLNDTIFYYMPSVSGRTAGALLGRFSGHDKTIDNIMHEIAELEQTYHSHAICAEIAHIPEERTGNVLFRKAFRSHVIPFLSGVQNFENQSIPIDDLYLVIEKGNLILYSKQLEVQIIPYLSNAHNYTNTKLPVYHFLCDYQYNNAAKSFGFQWGELANTRVKLPRVIYKNIILSKAKWFFTPAHFTRIKQHLKNTKMLLKEIESFQKKWRMPKYVSLVQGDNTLFIDLQNAFCVC